MSGRATRQRPKSGFRRLRTNECPTGKRGFATEEAALKMVGHVNSVNEKKGDGRRLRRTYMCELCFLYHVTRGGR